MPANDFQVAPPDILAIAGYLINTYFPQLLTARLAVLARPNRVAGKGDDGQPIVTVAATGANSDADAEFEYVIWVALDVWQILDGRAKEALLFAELSHCGRDANGKPVLNPHDEHVFTREVELYGAWWKDAHEQIKQLNAREGESKN